MIKIIKKDNSEIIGEFISTHCLGIHPLGYNIKISIPITEFKSIEKYLDENN